jgi:hypothetical protein
MKKFLWTYSLSIALGMLIPFTFDMWQFWVIALIGNILIFSRDNALTHNAEIRG